MSRCIGIVEGEGDSVTVGIVKGEGERVTLLRY